MQLFLILEGLSQIMDSKEKVEQFELEIVRLDDSWRLLRKEEDIFLKFLREHNYYITYLLVCSGGYDSQVILDDGGKGVEDRTPPLEELITMAVERKGTIVTPQYYLVDWVWFTMIKYMLDHVSEQQRKMLLDEQRTIDFKGTAYKFIFRYGFVDGEPFTRDDLSDDDLNDWIQEVYMPDELFQRVEADPVLSKLDWIWCEAENLPFIDEYYSSPNPDIETLITKIRDFHAQKQGRESQNK